MLRARAENMHRVSLSQIGLLRGYTLDAALMGRPGNQDIQLDLFLNYANNVKLYPAFEEYFRTSKPRLLAIWGKNDPYFIPAGAEAFQRDNPTRSSNFSIPDTSSLRRM